MQTEYDLIVAGGGVAGAALACASSRAGAHVLIVERELAFRDRVRGEGMHPWGVAEAEQLGLGGLLRERCARPARRWTTHVGGIQVAERDLAQTTAARMPGLNMHHPELQEALLCAAAQAGAQLRRGARVTAVAAGPVPRATVADGSSTTEVAARLVVVADGASSALRAQLGFELSEAPSPMRVSGLLLETAAHLDDAVLVFFPPGFGCVALVLPLLHDRIRVYIASHRALGRPLRSGPQGVAAFLDDCVELGVPRALLESARAAGPLASFDSACISARMPAIEGVALIGDAAGNVDPAFGCGLSLALRDARVLQDALRDTPDWHAATCAYASARAQYYSALVRVESWLHRILFGIGPEYELLRSTALAKCLELGVDLVGAGPDSASDEATRRALFG